MLLLLAAVLVLPAASFAQTWEEIVATADQIDFDGDVGVATGEVADEFASFVFTAPAAGPISAEVEVVEVREGRQYEDKDSVLFLFNENGYLIEQNDDGPTGWESLINGAILPDAGTYYLVVTTHPSFAQTDGDGYFTGFDEPGLSSFTFNIIVEQGVRDIEEEPAEYIQEEVVYDVADVFLSAEPLEYTGEPTTVRGSVAEGIAVFEIIAQDALYADIEVVPADGEADADSVLTILDAAGHAIYEDDDSGEGNASKVEDADLTDGVVYYAVVTSWPNYPIYGESGEVAGFPNTGQQEFTFDLVIAPAGDTSDPDQRESVDLPDLNEEATDFSEIVDSSTAIALAEGLGMAPGRVAAGYEAFEIIVADPATVDIEVVVSSVFQGRQYADSDSILSLFNEEGRLIAADDDGGEDSASMLTNVRLARRGSYYAVVTTYPNEPEVDDNGYFSAIRPSGDSHVGFQLVVREQ
jgi:hypothetical protein